MKKSEVFGIWLCLLGIYLTAFTFAGWAGGFYIGLLAFLAGSFCVLDSLWKRRKDR